MDALQQDVLAVVRKHIGISNANAKNSSAQIGMDGNGNFECSVRDEGDVCLFEMSVEIDGNTHRNGRGNGRRMV